MYGSSQLNVLTFNIYLLDTDANWRERIGAARCVTHKIVLSYLLNKFKCDANNIQASLIMLREFTFMELGIGDYPAKTTVQSRY